MMPLRVLVADDHALFRAGVANLLAAEVGFEVVGEAVDGRQALEMALELRPDVVLMDVSMPVMDGLEATRRIKAEVPAVRVVILSAADGERTVLEAARSGAKGCLSKKIDPQALFDTLRDVVQGDALASR